MVEVKNLSLQLVGKDIFTDVNFKLERGDKIGIIGGAGSGKSSYCRKTYANNRRNQS